MSLARILTLAGVLLMVLLPALETEAQRRGGGGGGGGGRGGGRSQPNVSRSGPANQGSIGHASRHSSRDMRGNRRETGQDARSSGREVRQDRGQTRGYNRNQARDEVSEHHEWHEDRWRRQVGARIAATTFRALTCQSTTIIVNGIAYYSCGGSWYTRQVSGTTVTYVVVTAPAGY